MRHKMSQIMIVLIVYYIVLESMKALVTGV